MSRRFYRGTRCQVILPDGSYCNRLFLDWSEHRRHVKRHARARKKRIVKPVRDIKEGIKRAREAITGGDVAIAAYLLDEPIEAIECVTGKGK